MMRKPNALAMKVCLETGLRISDVLGITRKQVFQNTFTVKENKTGKKRKIRLSNELKRECQAAAGAFYLFEGRDGIYTHRTRQAVTKDLKNVLVALERAGYMPRITSKKVRAKGKLVVGTHSMRKTFAHMLEEQGKDVTEIQHYLNHDREATTLVYIMAAEIDFRKTRNTNAIKNTATGGGGIPISHCNWLAAN